MATARLMNSTNGGGHHVTPTANGKSLSPVSTTRQQTTGLPSQLTLLSTTTTTSSSSSSPSSTLSTAAVANGAASVEAANRVGDGHLADIVNAVLMLIVDGRGNGQAHNASHANSIVNRLVNKMSLALSGVDSVDECSTASRAAPVIRSINQVRLVVAIFISFFLVVVYLHA